MDNTQAAYEFAAVQIENVATLIRKIASHQAEKASESAAWPADGAKLLRLDVYKHQDNHRVLAASLPDGRAIGIFLDDTHTGHAEVYLYKSSRDFSSCGWRWDAFVRINDVPASPPERDEPDGDRDYCEMKGAFEFACDKLGWDYGDGYAEYLDSKKNKPADEPPQRAEGVPAEDAPEWLAEYEGSELDEMDTCRLWADIQAEIARRVAEDRRDALCHCQKKLKEARAERDQARAEVEKFHTTDVGTLVADAVRADRESDERECRREIRRLRAEVERLKARQIPDSWEMSGTLGDSRRRIAELEAEVERLSRPVKWTELDKATHHDSPKYTSLGRVVGRIQCESFIQRERNAREAAEAAVAELRELLCTHYLMWYAAGASTEWSFIKRMKSCPDADLDAALAAYRKHKEPAK